MEHMIRKDKKGREYEHFILKNKKLIIKIGDKNELFKGDFKIVSRKGESKFGEEVLVEFLIHGKEKEYVASCGSGFDYTEVYLKPEEAKELFENFLKSTQKVENV